MVNRCYDVVEGHLVGVAYETRGVELQEIGDLDWVGELLHPAVVNDELGRGLLGGLAAHAISHVEEGKREESNCACRGSYLFPTLNWRHGVKVYSSIYRTPSLRKSQPAFSCFPPFRLLTFITLIINTNSGPPTNF